jgi:hypothetical protein
VRIPTEAEFESASSELMKSEEESTHKDSCEFCKFREELDKRNSIAKSHDDLCLFDKMTGDYLSQTELGVLALMQPRSVFTMIELARMSYYLGLKMGYAQRETEILEGSKLFEE